MTTWTQVASLTAPTAGAFDFPSLDFTGYEQVQVIGTGIAVTTDGTEPRLTFYVSGGAEVTTGYRWGVQAMSSTPGSADDGDAADAFIQMLPLTANFDAGNAAGEGFDCVIEIDQPNSTAFHKRAQFIVAATGPTGLAIGCDGEGVLDNAGAITGIKLTGSSALTAGNVRILGLA